MATAVVKSLTNRYWPLYVTGGSTALVIGWTFAASRRESGGHIVYASDDAYIHMTIARTLARHVWGINAGGFASASSSLLWILILAACDRLFGVHEAASLLINLLASVVLLWVVFGIMS